MPDFYRVDSPDVMHDNIDDEVVIIDLRTGIYYSIDGAGGVVWGALSTSGASVEGLVGLVSSRYDGQAEAISAAVERFVDELRSENLISPVSEDPVELVVDEPRDTSDPFVEPVLSKYSDMEQLLLADPIHDVEDTGWPDLKKT